MSDGRAEEPRLVHLSLLVPGSVSRDRSSSLAAGVHPPAVVLLELHPARVLSRDWRRLPAGALTPRLFPWFPLIQALVVGAVYFFRLEVDVGTSGSIYFSSGTGDEHRAGRELGCCCRCYSRSWRRCSPRWRSKWHARWRAFEALTGLHPQHRRQPRGRHRLCRDVVAGAAADGLVRRRLRRGVAASLAAGTARRPSMPAIAGRLGAAVARPRHWC